MATATAIGPTGPRVHQPRGGGARLTRTLVIVAGVAIATAMFVMIVALHSDSPDSGQAVRSDDAATVTSNEERAAIAELEAKARSQMALLRSSLLDSGSCKSRALLRVATVKCC